MLLLKTAWYYLEVPNIHVKVSVLANLLQYYIDLFFPIIYKA